MNQTTLNGAMQHPKPNSHRVVCSATHSNTCLQSSASLEGLAPSGLAFPMNKSYLPKSQSPYGQRPQHSHAQLPSYLSISSAIQTPYLFIFSAVHTTLSGLGLIVL